MGRTSGKIQRLVIDVGPNERTCFARLGMIAIVAGGLLLSWQPGSLQMSTGALDGA